jgi:hypothetical protein
MDTGVAAVTGKVNGDTDKTNQGMDEVVQSLAGLLIQAAPLATLLNSPQTPAVYRTNLRAAVGHERYVALAIALQAMSSWRTWERMHASNVAWRRRRSGTNDSK